MLVLVVVSFFDYDSVQIIPSFQFTNYIDVLGSAVTWRTYLNTLRYTVIVWAVTAVLGFTIAYVLAFEIKSRTAQMVLFLVCTVPFLTSNIIRMISWIPFLGREGLLNCTLIKLGLIHQPLEFLLFSDFAVVLAYTHLYALFMVTPIFNTMMRIDRRLLEAALDGGAGWWRTVYRGHPAAVEIRPRHRLHIRCHHGHGRLHHGPAHERRPERLGRPDDRQSNFVAAISGGLRQRGRAAGDRPDDDRRDPAHRRYQEGVVMAATLRRIILLSILGLFIAFLYGPTLTILVLSFQGPDGGLTFPMNGFSFHWFRRLFETQAVGDFGGSITRSFALATMVMATTVVVSLAAGMAFRRRFKAPARCSR